MSSKKPRILLIGAGAFGTKHLDTLLELEQKGELVLAGIVVKTAESQRKLQAVYKTPVYRGLTSEILNSVDAVDIVTPVETHFDIVSECLKQVHVFVEKPLTGDVASAVLLEKQAKKSKKALMVGHIFRFHPVVIELAKQIKKIKGKPLSVEGSFTNPIAIDNGRSVQLEMLHLFDIVEYLFNKKPLIKHSEDKGRTHTVSLTYTGGMRAVLKLGWLGEEKNRRIKITYKFHTILGDLEKNIVNVYEKGVLKHNIVCNKASSPLERELRHFVSVIKGKMRSYPDAHVGVSAVKTALWGQVVKENTHAKSVQKNARPKVAVIGAGIFGTNCAIELASFCDVTIFEKNKHILSEASHINQYRHHWGYHYPRSQETVADIRSAITDFEERYNDAVIREFPTYYSMAKKGSKVTTKEFLEFCDRNKLPYTIEHPHEDFLDRTKVDISLKTYEPIYNFEKLKGITEELLTKHAIKLSLASEVVGAKMLSHGQKELRIKKGTVTRTETFDYVINVTYARYNDFCSWLKIPQKQIRLDLVEVLWVKLNMPKISLAVMDGKFTNIVPTGKDGIFTLVHIKESVLRRFVPKNGLVPKNIFDSAQRSRVQRILAKSIEWFPFVKHAEIVKVHYVLRGVNAYREHDDARTSDITEHGFGTFSILGGKIINAVTTAKALARLIKK